MNKNGFNKKSNYDQIISIFDSNIPRRINFNSFINNVSPLILCKENNPISTFNPYDTEIDNNYNNGNKKFSNKKEIEKSSNYNDNFNHLLFYESNINPDEKIQEEIQNSNLFIKKLNNYINISSDEEYHVHKNKNNIERNFISPKLNIRKNNEYTKLTQYSTKIKNNKDVYFTDLKRDLNNIKIKSTNYSSNISYDYNDRKDKKENVLKNIYENTYIEKKNKKNITENKKMKKIPILRSTIELGKTLKTIDEYMEFKKGKSKHKHSHSKKKETNFPKNNSSIKSKVVESNKKEKNKSKNKEKRNKLKNKTNKKNEILNEEKQIKKKGSNENKNEDKKEENEEIKEQKENESSQSEDKNDNVIYIDDDIAQNNTQNKNSKSIPKVKTNKRFFFRSFLCCFGCNNLDINEDDNKCKNNTPNEVNKISDININKDTNINKLNDKNSKNKSNKLKKKK